MDEPSPIDHLEQMESATNARIRRIEGKLDTLAPTVRAAAFWSRIGVALLVVLLLVFMYVALTVTP